MKLEINPRGNGACPLCKFNVSCGIKRALQASVVSQGGKDEEMEIAVYSCPRFKEKD